MDQCSDPQSPGKNPGNLVRTLVLGSEGWKLLDLYSSLASLSILVDELGSVRTRK